jgi:hypothetical protein
VDIERDGSGDILVTEDGSVPLIEGLTETAQRLRCKFLSFRGEWFLDPSEGLPYREIVLDKSVPLTAKVALFRSVLQRDPAIVAVNQLSLTPHPSEARRWVLNFSATTTEGLTLTSTDFTPFVVG